MAEHRAIVAVLAGGRGRRMDGAKATAPLGGRPLIAYPLAAARASGLPRVVVAKRDTALPPLEEQVLIEPQRPRHPLCGVLAALEHAHELAPPAAIVLAACDMPFLTGELLAWLGALPGAAMARVAGRPQPLLARCTPAHGPLLREALREELSLTAAIGRLDPQVVAEAELARFGEPERLCFNVNEPADLRRAEAWLA